MSKVTIESLQSRIKEIIQETERPNEDGGIEMYLDYRDTLSNNTLYDIMKSDNPRELFDELIDEWTVDGSLYYENELEKEIRNSLTAEEIDFFNEHSNEFWDWFREYYYFYYDTEHYNETVKVNIMLDTGNLNYDCTCDNILNYCGNKEIDKDSSILWLVRQFKKVCDFRKIIRSYKPGYYKDGGWIDREKYKDPFIESCIQELENLPSHMATLTFLVNMKLFDYFDLREAMAAEKKLNDSYIYSERKGTGTITISKDTMCGLFDVWSGGGSSLDIELEKDLVIPIKSIWVAEIETGKSEYGYSVDNVYGLVGSAWDGEIKETHYMTEEEIKKVEEN